MKNYNILNETFEEMIDDIKYIKKATFIGCYKKNWYTCSMDWQNPFFLRK